MDTKPEVVGPTRSPLEVSFFIICGLFWVEFCPNMWKLGEKKTSPEWFALFPLYYLWGQPLFLSLVGQELFQEQSPTFASVLISSECIGGRVSFSVFCFRLGRKVTCQDVRQGDGPEGEGVRKRRRWGSEGKSDGRSSENPDRVLILILTRREWWALNRGRRFEGLGSDLPLLPPLPAGSGRGRGG